MEEVNSSKHLRAWPCFTVWRTTVFYDLGCDTLCSSGYKLKKQQVTGKDLLSVHCSRSPCPVWCEWCSVHFDDDYLKRREQEHSIPGLESVVLGALVGELCGHHCNPKKEIAQQWKNKQLGSADSLHSVLIRIRLACGCNTVVQVVK